MFFSILVAALGWYGCNHNAPAEDEGHSAHQQDSGTQKPLSPRMQTMDNIAGTHVHIDYSSPSVRGRTIWNGLVAYGQVWATGAHTATSIDFSTEVTIGGQHIPKGKYAFFTIPGEKEWILILNKNYDQHLADNYDQNLDIVRLTVQPQPLEENVESLTYKVIPGAGNKGKIRMSWEKLKVEFDVEGQETE